MRAHELQDTSNHPTTWRLSRHGLPTCSHSGYYACPAHIALSMAIIPFRILHVLRGRGRSTSLQLTAEGTFSHARCAMRSSVSPDVVNRAELQANQRRQLKEAPRRQAVCMCCSFRVDLQIALHGGLCGLQMCCAALGWLASLAIWARCGEFMAKLLSSLLCWSITPSCVASGTLPITCKLS